MTILSISRRAKACGVTDYAGDVEAELRRLGHHVTVACPWSGATLSRRRFDRIVAQFEIVSATREATIFPLLFALTVAKARGTPSTVVCHTVLNEEMVRKASPALRGTLRFYHRAVLRALQRLSSIFVLNAASVEFLQSNGIRARHVMRGAPVPPPLTGASRLSDAKKNGLVICAIAGNPYAYKRFELAARAFADLDDAAQARALFVVLGGDDGVDRAASQRLARELARVAPERVVNTGLLELPEFWEALADVDIVLLPHEDVLLHSDISSRVAAARVPAIVSSARGLQWLVRTGGAVVAENWPDDATALLRRLILDSHERERLRRAYAESPATPSLAQSVATLIEVPVSEPIAT
jgi:glycosyltransferase involved in cell wall biosynthesis